MDRDVLLRRLDEERRTLARGDEVLDVLPAVTRVRSPYHALIFSCLVAGDADDVIAGEIEHHRKLGVDFEWKLYAHDMPADMLARLKHHGFRIGPVEAVLVFDLANVCEWIERAGNCDVLRVDRPEQVEAYRNAAEAVFGRGQDLAADEVARALSSGSTHVRGYMSYADGQPAGVGRLQLHPQSVFGGYTGAARSPLSAAEGSIVRLLPPALVTRSPRDAAI